MSDLGLLIDRSLGDTCKPNALARQALLCTCVWWCTFEHSLRARASTIVLVDACMWLWLLTSVLASLPMLHVTWIGMLRPVGVVP